MYAMFSSGACEKGANYPGSMTAELLQLCPTCGTLWTVASQAPLSTGFSRQEYWSGLQRGRPFPQCPDTHGVQGEGLGSRLCAAQRREKSVIQVKEKGLGRNQP